MVKLLPAVVIGLYVFLVLSPAASAAGESATDGKTLLTAPGEQRPFTKTLRLSETKPEENAVWETRMAHAERYTDLSQILCLLSIVALACYALAFHYLRFGKIIHKAFGERTGLATCVAGTAVVIWIYILALPLLALRTYLAATNGLLSIGFWQAFRNSALAGFVLAIIGSILLIVLLLLMRRFHRLWWAILAVILTLIILSVAPLYPRRLPLTEISGEPMSEEKSAELVRNLIEPGTGESLRLYVDKSGTYSNLIWARSAFFSREIIVSNGALENLTPYELEVLVAHELAYFETGYRATGFLIIVVVLFTGLFITDLVMPGAAELFRIKAPPDPRGNGVLTAIILVVFILAVPIINGYSRYSERGADDYAIRLTRKPVTAAELYRKEAAANLSAPRPNAVLHLLLDAKQPPTDRIAQARALRQELAR
jgi:Zn-dependent protease with chaperone function